MNKRTIPALVAAVLAASLLTACGELTDDGDDDDDCRSKRKTVSVTPSPPMPTGKNGGRPPVGASGRPYTPAPKAPATKAPAPLVKAPAPAKRGR